MNDEKLLNLAGGKILYKDLRDRIEETAEEFHEATTDVLRHSSQDLTEEEKEQARTNIDAVSVEQMDVELNDLWDETDSINNILTKYNCVELYNPRPATYEDQGITFTWTDKNTCIVTGTPTATAIDLYLYVENPLLGNSLGRDRFLHFKSTGDKTQVRLEYFTTDELIDEQIAKEDTVFTIPENCMRLKVPLEVPGGSGEVNETIEIGIFSAPSNMELWNGAVKDVQVDGTSVAANGVANVPIVSAYGNTGVVKIVQYRGLDFEQSTGALTTQIASDIHIKGGVTGYAVIDPFHQHQSTFYGLAKAAGHDEKNSTESIGTYTPEAKGAIQQMLGVSDLIAPAENDLVASQAYAVGDIFTANGKLYKVTTAIAADGAIVLQNEGETVSGANAVETKIGEGFVKFTDYATSSTPGVVKVNDDGTYGIRMLNGQLVIKTPASTAIKNGTSGNQPITPLNQNEATFYGLAKAAGDTSQSQSNNAVGTYTDNAKASIKAMLGIQDGSTGTVDVTGTTPTITAVENTRYVCDEVTSLNFTPAASGICIVRFTSGSTVTVLTLPSTVKFPEWFDPTSLETNTIYEICVTDGIYGAVMSWAQ